MAIRVRFLKFILALSIFHIYPAEAKLMVYLFLMFELRSSDGKVQFNFLV
jgi:hypothetical protein